MIALNVCPKQWFYKRNQIATEGKKRQKRIEHSQTSVDLSLVVGRRAVYPRFPKSKRPREIGLKQSKPSEKYF